MATSAVATRRKAAPPLETTLDGQQLVPTTSSGRAQRTPPSSQHGTPERTHTAPRHDYQRFVLTDPIAFQYLEADKSTQVLARHQELQGYECYLVEQWITSRTHPTFVISTYTGDTSHAVFVDVLGVPSDEQTWSPRLRVYFKALNQYHARRETTPLGTLMVTNLTSFPSTLTVIPIPQGEIRQHLDEFTVNENLKRMGCSGRLGLTLAPPPANTVAKFHQLYHTSDKNAIHESVVELVKLCQVALTMFDKLEPDYADGLLCDVTEHAISKWWNDIGTDQYGVEPHDGVLGPTTVAALLGTLMGVRNRLHSYGMSVTKDPFDLDSMKHGISSFQKQQRLERTRRLDRPTMQRLLRATAKAAAHEGWTVPRAVKSTVAELSGRGGEMLSDVIGRRDRAGIADIETTDYERFVQLAFGPNARWLWQGKPMKKSKSPETTRIIPPFSAGENASTNPAKKPDSVRDGKQADEPHTPGDTDDSGPEDGRRKLRKRATDLKNEAMSGFGKIKGVVHLKSHQQRFAPRGEDFSQSSPPRADEESDSSAGSPFSGPTSPFSQTADHVPDSSLDSRPGSPPSTHTRARGHSRLSPKDMTDRSTQLPPSIDPPEHRARQTPPVMPIGDGVYAGVDLGQALPAGSETQHGIGTLLRRTISDKIGTSASDKNHDSDYYPRHLSFSLAEDSVLPWNALTDEMVDGDSATRAKYAQQALLAEDKRILRLSMNETQAKAVEWTQQQLYVLRGIAQQYQVDAEELVASYSTQREHLQSVTTNADVLMTSERERLDEGNKELETLSARLTYEVNGLESRMDDVERIVDDFERSVVRVEERVAELEQDDDGTRQWRCIIL